MAIVGAHLNTYASFIKSGQKSVHEILISQLISKYELLLFKMKLYYF